MNQATNAPQWYQVTIPAAECGIKAKRLQNDFEILFTINDTPNGAALFTRHDENAENQHFYFSPGAVAIARGLIQYFSGKPCGTPLANATLLVGHAGERDVLLSTDTPPKSTLDRILHRQK
jgi:hypothetical protein